MVIMNHGGEGKFMPLRSVKATVTLCGDHSSKQSSGTHHWWNKIHSNLSCTTSLY